MLGRLLISISRNLKMQRKSFGVFFGTVKSCRIYSNDCLINPEQEEIRLSQMGMDPRLSHRWQRRWDVDIVGQKTLQVLSAKHPKCLISICNALDCPLTEKGYACLKIRDRVLTEEAPQPHPRERGLGCDDQKNKGPAYGFTDISRGGVRGFWSWWLLILYSTRPEALAKKCFST